MTPALNVVGRTTPADARLFTDLVGWLGPRLRNPTWGGLLGFLQEWLAPEAVAKLNREVLLLDDRAQRRAENLLIAYLEKPIDRAVHAAWISDTIERSVDWPRTFSDFGGARQARYWLREVEPARDSELVGALLGLAASWATLLALSAGSQAPHAARAARLRELIDRVGSGPYAPYGIVHERRLLARGDEGRRLAAALRAVDVMRRWSRPLIASDEGQARGLRRHLLDLGGQLKKLAQNEDLLLELSVRLAIARAALELEGDERWELVAAIGLPPRGGSKHPSIELRRGGLRCRITKGLPSQNVGGRDYTIPDRLVAVGRQMGLAPNGNQPDVLICFYRAAAPEQVVFALGDAKRNEAGRGRGYLGDSLEVATVYAVSYGHLLGVSMPANVATATSFTGVVDPAVTLFCLQVPAIDALASATLAATFDGRGERLPFAMAISVERHLGQPFDGEPAYPVLRAWVRRLVDQATQALDEGRAYDVVRARAARAG